MVDYLVAIATVVGVQALLTLGLNVHYGLTGLVNFGHVAFYALGAYSSALLTLAGVPFLLAMAVGVVLAVAASALVGAATLRLREDYFAIVTLGFSELLRLLLINVRELTRGTLGIPGIRSADHLPFRESIRCRDIAIMAPPFSRYRDIARTETALSVASKFTEMANATS